MKVVGIKKSRINGPDHHFAKEAKMTKKVNGTKAVAEKTAKVEPKAQGGRAMRTEFIEKFGKKIAEAWASFPQGKATSAGTWKKVFPKAESPQRLTDYALVALGLKQTKDKGLLAWAKEDGAKHASPPPSKAKKA
jgi:hypothetical protein